jgi:acetyl-CoA synthetase
MMDPGRRRCGLNIADLAVDRHVDDGHGHRQALLWVGGEGRRVVFTFADLKQESDRFANVLDRLGLTAGDTVAVCTGRIPELYIAALGIWKRRCVFCPLFSEFGADPLFHRLMRSRAIALLTTQDLYRRNVADLQKRLPALRHVLLTDAADHTRHGLWSLPGLMKDAVAPYTVPATDPEDHAILHFTSGTSGMPKGAVHVHDALRTHYETGRCVLDLHPQDVFWCTADPAWVTGTSYGIIAPLLIGATNIVDGGEFQVERWYRILSDQAVTVWYTSPSAIRRLMRYEGNPRQTYDLKALRLIFSVGEPLAGAAVDWAEEVLGLPIYDTWWQTETGAIMLSSVVAPCVRPGSMGVAIPGITAAVVRRIGKERLAVTAEPNTVGELALKPGWSSMFRSYLDAPDEYAECFRGGWYLSGDLVQCDVDGYFWFVGRADDIIKTAGHLVSPFEVESLLMTHPDVFEAAAIGVPDEMIGERVKAIVSLKPGILPGADLRRELLAFARRRLGPAIAPREVEFSRDLPKNQAGKVLRRTLRARNRGGES